MNANEITFGVEIECYLPYDVFAQVGLIVGGYHHGVQVPGLPAGWNAQGDGSIRAPRGKRGVEIVSPILKGADGLAQIRQVCRTLAAWRAKVNRSCGLHVHVGVGRETPATELDKLVACVANHEKALYAASGTKARERGQFCRPLANGGPRAAAAVAASRYQSLNVQNLLYGTKPTVEFRAFSGSLNAEKIIGWVRLAVGMVQRGLELTRSPKWVAKPTSPTSPIKRGGDGETAITRLLYWLGWTKGRVPTVYGGVGDDASVKRSKKELVKLARKYDAD